MYPGDTAECTAPGNPAPVLSWRKISANCTGQPEGCVPGNGPNIVAGATLTIDDSYVGFNTYRCVATSDIGGLSRTTTISSNPIAF